MDHAAKGENRDPALAAPALTADFTFADRERTHLVLGFHAGTGAPWIANRARTLEAKSGIEHLSTLVLVRWSHHGRVRQTAQVREIKASRVRRPVRAHKPGAIDGEYNGKILNDHVVNELVIGALQERRIDRHNRLEAFARESCGKRDGVLLGDSDIEIAIGKELRKAHQPRAFAHGRRNSDQTRVARSHVAEPIAKYLRVRRLAAALGRIADGGVEFSDAVIQNRIFFGLRIPETLARDDV